MDIKEIENQVMHLPETDRADLAQKILLSLDMPSIDEIEDEWLAEAQRRAKDLDEGVVQPISAEEVRKKAQALLR